MGGSKTRPIVLHQTCTKFILFDPTVYEIPILLQTRRRGISSSFFIARFSARVAGAAARD